MHEVKTQKSGKLFGKNMLVFNFFYLVIIKNCMTLKNYLTNVRKDWNKFPEIPREISELNPSRHSPPTSSSWYGPSFT